MIIKKEGTFIRKQIKFFPSWVTANTYYKITCCITIHPNKLVIFIFAIYFLTQILPIVLFYCYLTLVLFFYFFFSSVVANAKKKKKKSESERTYRTYLSKEYQAIVASRYLSFKNRCSDCEVSMKVTLGHPKQKHQQKETLFWCNLVIYYQFS